MVGWISAVTGVLALIVAIISLVKSNKNSAQVKALTAKFNNINIVQPTFVQGGHGGCGGGGGAIYTNDAQPPGN